MLWSVTLFLTFDQFVNLSSHDKDLNIETSLSILRRFFSKIFRYCNEFHRKWHLKMILF